MTQNMAKKSQCLLTAGSKIQQPQTYEHLPIEDVIDVIVNGRYHDQNLKDIIMAIRRESPKEVASSLKRSLPFFTGSFYEASRSNANVSYAAYAIMDLDHVQDIPAVKKRVMDTLTYAYCAFQSVNDGVKIIIHLDPVITDEAHYRAAYEVLKQNVHNITGIIPDSTPDWARACFFSYDPDILVNTDCQGFTCQIPQVPKSCPSKTVISSSASDYDRARQVVQALAGMKISYKDWIKLGFALKSAFGDRGKVLWDLFAYNPNFSDSVRYIEHKWHSFGSSGAVGIATVFYIGGKYGIR